MLHIGIYHIIEFNVDFSIKFYNLSDGTVREQNIEFKKGNTITVFPLKKELDGYLCEVEGYSMDATISFNIGDYSKISNK